MMNCCPFKKLLASCLLSFGLLQPAHAAKAEAENTIAWGDLTPAVDAGIYQRYQEKTISAGELREYIHKFNNTAMNELDDQLLSITGYLLPQNLDDNGISTRFALVRQVGSWTHTENRPPANQIISVHFDKGLLLNQSTVVRFQVSGTMNVGEFEMPIGDSFYQIEAIDIDVNRKRFNEIY